MVCFTSISDVDSGDHHAKKKKKLDMVYFDFKTFWCVFVVLAKNHHGQCAKKNKKG